MFTQPKSNVGCVVHNPKILDVGRLRDRESICFKFRDFMIVRSDYHLELVACDKLASMSVE